MAAIRCTGVVKQFERTRALDAVDLIVADGQVRGLLGPNGAGKTTLLRILLGLVTADAGEVVLFDRERRPDEPLDLTAVAGFVEDPRFYPYLSGRVNLELAARLDGLARDAETRVRTALQRVGLGDRGEDRVSGYSSGMRQRLGIAACLLRAPQLLILDEPTAGLDPEGVRDMGTLVAELSADGVAILLSSHQIGEVEGVCDAFTVLRKGRVVWDGTGDELRAQAPESAYGLETSDDTRALELAARSRGIRAEATTSGGLALTAEGGCLDPYVVGLGQANIAIRRLELLVSPLESMFFALTSETELDERTIHASHIEVPAP